MPLMPLVPIPSILPVAPTHVRVLRRWARAGVAVLAALAAAVAAAVVAPAPSTAYPLRAAAAPTQGRGYVVGGGDFVGFYRTAAGTPVYCLSPRRALPRTLTLGATAQLPGAGPGVTAAVSYALARWGAAPDDAAAAAESQVLNLLVGNGADVRRRASQLPVSVHRVVTSHVAIARAMHGPYRVIVRAPALLPGQHATGTVVVRAASGRIVPGRVVRLRASRNLALPDEVSTRAGVGRFGYRVYGLGEQRIVATAAGLPSARVLVNSPAPGEQRMVSWAVAESARGGVAGRRAAGGFAHRYSCDTACAGRPTVTVGACLPGRAARARLVVRAGARTVLLRFAPAGARLCRTATLPMPDGVRVRAGWQFRTAHGWTVLEPAAGTFTVDCPAVPAVSIAMTYDCAVATVSARVPAVAGHAVVLVVTGSTARRIVASRGSAATFSARTSCARPAGFTFRAGVQRRNGAWNYGPVAAVATPHAARP